MNALHCIYRTKLAYQGMSGKSSTKDDDLSVLNVRHVAEEIIRIELDVERGSTIRELRDQPLGFWSSFIIIGWIEQFGSILGRISNLRADVVIRIGIRSRNHNGT